jgi:hypothetical protein
MNVLFIGDNDHLIHWLINEYVALSNNYFDRISRMYEYDNQSNVEQSNP